MYLLTISASCCSCRLSINWCRCTISVCGHRWESVLIVVAAHLALVLMLHTWCSCLSLQALTTIVLLYFGSFNGISYSLFSASRVVIPYCVFALWVFDVLVVCSNFFYVVVVRSLSVTTIYSILIYRFIYRLTTPLFHSF